MTAISGAQSRLRPFHVLALLAFITLVTTACSRDPLPVRVATLPWPPFDLMQLEGAQDVPGLESFELLEFQTPAEVMRAFRYELVDVVLITSHIALSAMSDVTDTRIIYVVDVSQGGDALITRQGIGNANALRGERIGVEASPLGTYILIRALEQLELSRDEIEVVHIDTPEQAAAFRTGHVDGLITYEPTRSILIAEGAKQLFDSKSIPYEVIDVVVTRQRVIDERPEALSALVRSIDRGIGLFQQDPERAARELTDRYNLDHEDYRNTLHQVELFRLEDNLEVLGDPESAVYRGLVKQCQVMVENGLLVSMPNLDPLVDQRVIRQATGS